MKKIFFKFFVVQISIIVFLLLSVISSWAISIYLDYAPNAVIEKQNFQIDLRVDLGFEEISSFGFDLSYATGWTFSYLLNPEFDNVSDWSGDTDIAAFSLAFPPLTGDTFLASLFFTAPSTGDFNLAITSDWMESFTTFDGLFSNMGIYDFNVSRKVTVKPAVVPEPAGLYILGIGLIYLVGFGKRGLNFSSKK